MKQLYRLTFIVWFPGTVLFNECISMGGPFTSSRKRQIRKKKIKMIGTRKETTSTKKLEQISDRTLFSAAPNATYSFWFNSQNIRRAVNLQ